MLYQIFLRERGGMVPHPGEKANFLFNLHTSIPLAVGVFVQDPRGMTFFVEEIIFTNSDEVKVVVASRKFSYQFYL